MTRIFFCYTFSLAVLYQKRVEYLFSEIRYQLDRILQINQFFSPFFCHFPTFYEIMTLKLLSSEERRNGYAECSFIRHLFI